MVCGQGERALLVVPAWSRPDARMDFTDPYLRAPMTRAHRQAASSWTGSAVGRPGPQTRTEPMVPITRTRFDVHATTTHFIGLPWRKLRASRNASPRLIRAGTAAIRSRRNEQRHNAQ